MLFIKKFNKRHPLIDAPFKIIPRFYINKTHNYNCLFYHIFFYRVVGWAVIIQTVISSKFIMLMFTLPSGWSWVTLLEGNACLVITPKFDGYEDSLLISSNLTACGHELGWKYGEQVMTSRETFTGFFKVMNARYNWSTFPGKFLLPGAFIKWWSGWTSLMEINFWEICEMCDVKIDYLACDSTKIGMWGSWKGIFNANWNANK